jgi:hypothetical protein
MDTRAVALQGVGYSPLALALQGFWGVVPELVVTGGWATIRLTSYPSTVVYGAALGTVSDAQLFAPEAGEILISESAGPGTELSLVTLGYASWSWPAAILCGGPIIEMLPRSSVSIAARPLGELSTPAALPITVDGPEPAVLPIPISPNPQSVRII